MYHRHHALCSVILLDKTLTDNEDECQFVSVIYFVISPPLPEKLSFSYVQVSYKEREEGRELDLNKVMGGSGFGVCNPHV